MLDLFRIKLSPFASFEFYVAAECAFAHLAPKNSVQRKIISTSLRTKRLGNFVVAHRSIISVRSTKILGRLWTRFFFFLRSAKVLGRIVLSSSINIVKKSILFNVQVRHAFTKACLFIFISVTIFHKQVKYFLLYQKKIYIENFNIKA